MSYLLGIDIGTSGTKTLLCDPQGLVRATAMAGHEVSSPQPGWSEQDPAHWWSAACEATNKVLHEAGIDGGQVTGVGLSGQMHGSVFLGQTGSTKPLRPAILWNDQRTAKQCEQIEQRMGGRKNLIERVGNPALPGFTAPKILWVRDNEPKVYQKTRNILLPKDYVRLCMTGDYATDVGDASGTLLLDVKRRAYSGEVLDALEIDPGMLATVYESHQITGTLQGQAASAMGLTEGTPVVGGSGDQPAGAVGNGIVSTGNVSATLGTSGVVFAHSDEPTYDPHGRVHTMCSAVEGKWCVFGCMLSAGGSLQWLRDTLGQSEIATADYEGIDPYELLIEQAEQATPGCEGLFFLPYLTGERCPHPNPNARGGWIGLTARHNRRALIRSLIEGVTFGMADAMQIMDRMGIDIQTVRLSGGGARSAFWRQLQADVYAKPCATINADEGPAYGAAILAGVGTETWPSVPDACQSIISQTDTYEPVQEMQTFYAVRHKQYQRLYRALSDEFDRIAAL